MTDSRNAKGAVKGHLLLLIPVAAFLFSVLSVSLLWVVGFKVTGHVKPRFVGNRIFEANIVFACNLVMGLLCLAVMQERRGYGGARFRAVTGSALCTALCFGVMLGLLNNISGKLVLGHAIPSGSSTLLQLATGLLASAVAAPFGEELFFRGLILNWMEERFSFLAAVVLNAVLFGLVHIAAYIGSPLVALDFAFPAVLAVASCRWAMTNKSLWQPVAAHSTYNFTVVVSHYLLSKAAV